MLRGEKLVGFLLICTFLFNTSDASFNCLVNGLLGTYYEDVTFNGTELLRRTDDNINFDWGTAGLGGGVLTTKFSVEWNGFITADVAGYYGLTVNFEGMFRIIMESNVIVPWTYSMNTNSTYTASNILSLIVNIPYPFIFQYAYNGTSGASVQLEWTSPSGISPYVIPEARFTSHSCRVPAINIDQGILLYDSIGYAYFQISLNSIPTSNVTVSIQTNGLVASTCFVTFTPATWNVSVGVYLYDQPIPNQRTGTGDFIVIMSAKNLCQKVW